MTPSVGAVSEAETVADGSAALKEVPSVGDATAPAEVKESESESDDAEPDEPEDEGVSTGLWRLEAG